MGAVFLSLLASLTVIALAEHRPGRVVLAVLAFAPLVAVYLLADPSYRLYAGHGFQHAAHVYEILEGVVPPTNPMLANADLLVTWGYDLLAAGLSLLFGISPFRSFAVVNGVSLFVALVFTYRLSRLLVDQRVANVFSVLLALYCVHVLNLTPVHQAVARALGLEFPVRAFVMLPKFMNTSAMPLGTACFVASLFYLLRLAEERRPSGRTAGLLFVFMTLQGLSYPTFYWPSLVIALAVLGLRYGSHPPRRGGYRLGFVALWASAVPVGLYTYSLIGLDPGAVGAGLSFPSRSNLLWLVALLLDVSAFGLLLGWAWAPLQDLLAPRRRAVFDLAVAFGLMTLPALTAISENYKFVLLCQLILGIGAGPALFCVCRRSKVAAVVLLGALLVPTIRDVERRAAGREGWRMVAQFEDGRTLRFEDDARDELYRWVLASTSVDDIFLDLALELPIYGRRSIYIAPRGYYPGFGDMESLKGGLYGYDRALLERRFAIQERIFGSGAEAIDAAVLRRLEEDPDAGSSRGEIYMVARTPRVARKLDASPRLQRVFEGQFASVFRLQPVPGVAR